MPGARIAVDFGGTHIRFAVVDTDLHDLKVIRTHAELPREELRAHFLDALAAYLAETGLAATAASINVAIAGQIDSRAGVVVASPNVPTWAGAPVKAWVEARFGKPVFVDNDVRAATLGEMRSPALLGTRDLVCLYWGTGVGGGIVVDGKLLRGVGNAAGEIGHTVYVPGGLRCHCGKAGCFEAYAGGWAIPRAAALAAQATGEQALGAELPTGEIFALADAGHPLATRVRNEAVRALGILAANLVVTFNPEVLVLGGGMVQRFPQAADWVGLAIEENVLAADKPGFRLHVSNLGAAAALWGAVTLAEIR
jgi:glucokinase